MLDLAAGICSQLATTELVRSAWLEFCVPVHPKGFEWSCGQGSMQTSEVYPHQTGKLSFFLFYFIFLTEVGGHHTAERRKDISGKLGAHHHLKYYINK